jgi:AhpD family alkylhydroperoxidase
MSTETTTRPPRFSMAADAREAYRAMAAFDRAISFDPPLRELVKLRASQLNGCAFCIDMHARDAHRLGESERRLLALAAWRESPLFTPRERAALAVCDAVTHIDRAGLPDDVYAAAQAEFDDGELAQLVFAIGAIGVWNRVSVSTGITFDEPWPDSWT